MIWFFHQGHAQIDLEVCRTGRPVGYQLVVTYPDGTEQLEEFRDAKALVERVVEVEDRLLAAGWRPGTFTSEATLGPVGEPPGPDRRSRRLRARGVAPRETAERKSRAISQ